MTDTSTDRDQLTQAVCDKAHEIAPNGGRDQVWYGADGCTARTTATRKQPDGTTRQWEITASRRYDQTVNVEVIERVDNNDWFWQPIADEPDSLRKVVIGDTCYTITPDAADPGWGSGYGGQRFVIEWLDSAGEPTGETVTTRNLWHRGTIPPAWRARLAPNARFVKETS